MRQRGSTTCQANWKWLRQRYLPGWWPTQGETRLFDPAAGKIVYSRYRGPDRRDTLWAAGSTA